MKQKRGSGFGIVIFIIILLIILVVGSIVWGIFREEDVQSPVISEDTVDPLEKQIEAEINSITSDSTVADCDGVIAKDECYLKLAYEKEDRSLCALINYDHYRERCEANVG